MQRQEELAQLWQQLLSAEKAMAVAESLAAQERERRQVEERQLATTEADATELRAQLQALRSSPPVSDHLIAEVVELTRLLQEQEALTQATASATSGAEDIPTQQANEISQLQSRFQQQEAAAQAADATLVSTEQRLSARFDEIARLTSMLADEGTRTVRSVANADWLLRMMQMAAQFPKWWALMPQGWRQQREHQLGCSA